MRDPGSSGEAPLVAVEKFDRPAGKLYGSSLNGRRLRRGLFSHTKAQAYAQAVAARLQHWSQVDRAVLSLPIGFRDQITTVLEINLSLGDRLKLLLGWRIGVQLDTLCEQKPVAVRTSTELRLGPPAWWLRARYGSRSRPGVVTSASKDDTDGRQRPEA